MSSLHVIDPDFILMIKSAIFHTGYYGSISLPFSLFKNHLNLSSLIKKKNLKITCNQSTHFYLCSTCFLSIGKNLDGGPHGHKINKSQLLYPLTYKQFVCVRERGILFLCFIYFGFNYIFLFFFGGELRLF